MTAGTIPIEEIIGKTITDIRCIYGKEDGWLDTAECFIQLDGKFYIDIPYGQSKEASITAPGPEAKTIFGDLSDIPYYHVNTEGKSIAEVAKAHKKKDNVFTRMIRILFGSKQAGGEYMAYKTELRENKLKHIVNRTIVDYLWEDDTSEKGFFELDNGYLISDQYMAPHGTGLAGLHYYENFGTLPEWKRDNLKRYSGLNANKHNSRQAGL